MKCCPFLIITVGVVLLARNLGFIPAELIHTWWPIVLIAIGAGMLRCRSKCSGQSGCCMPGSCKDDTSK